MGNVQNFDSYCSRNSLSRKQQIFKVICLSADIVVGHVNNLAQDTNPRSQQSVNVLYCVLSMITTCFGLRKRPSSGDYHVIQNIRKKVTIRCNGSVESNRTIIG
jgi:hypothetical protein